MRPWNVDPRKKKPWHKPGKVFKRLRERARRSGRNQALRAGYEPEREPHDDVWEYN